VIIERAAPTHPRRRALAALWLALLAGGAVVVAAACGDANPRAARGETVQLAFRAPDGVGRPPTAAHVAAVERALGSVDHVRDVRDLAISPDGTVLLGEIRLDGPPRTAPASTVRTIVEIAEYSDTSHVIVDVSGPAVEAIERGGVPGWAPLGIVAALATLGAAAHFASVRARRRSEHRRSEQLVLTEARVTRRP
jgi:hypothetical protein